MLRRLGELAAVVEGDVDGQVVLKAGGGLAGTPSLTAKPRKVGSQLCELLVQTKQRVPLVHLQDSDSR